MPPLKLLSAKLARMNADKMTIRWLLYLHFVIVTFSFSISFLCFLQELHLLLWLNSFDYMFLKAYENFICLVLKMLI